MMNTSENIFYLIGSDGSRYVPYKKENRKNGKYGYEILPSGYGNDPSRAEYTEDVEQLVRKVVMEGLLVRSRVVGGMQDGQSNSVGLPSARRRTIKGYWLTPNLRYLTAGAQLQSEARSDDVVHFPNAEEDILSARDLPDDETQRKAVIDARRGQGKFRDALDAWWAGCAVTGCLTRELLRASHIQPWREASNADRISRDNGLLLAAHLNAAFDQGIISFSDEGNILINTHRLPAKQAVLVGIHHGLRLRRVESVLLPYLARHRQLHGFA